MKKLIAICMALTICVTLQAATVSGNPSLDSGWTLAGHSLENGVYVKGSANYGYDAYGAGFTIQAGSNLEISDGELSWLAGDNVVGVGGVFRGITAAEAGWNISGTGINSLLPQTTPYSGPKLQAKFGTSDASWYTSTAAPGSGNGNSSSSSGNGNSSSSSGGGRVQVRTSAYFQAGTPLSGQTEPWTWDGNSGQLLVLDKEDHVSWDGDDGLDKRVARMIWNWDSTANRIVSWQLLLNVSLLDRVAPDEFAGLLPSIGDKAVMTVQNGGGAYTDALVTTVVPEPATLALLGFGGLCFRRMKKA